MEYDEQTRKQLINLEVEIKKLRDEADRLVRVRLNVIAQYEKVKNDK